MLLLPRSIKNYQYRSRNQQFVTGAICIYHIRNRTITVRAHWSLYFRCFFSFFNLFSCGLSVWLLIFCFVCFCFTGVELTCVPDGCEYSRWDLWGGARQRRFDVSPWIGEICSPCSSASACNLPLPQWRVLGVFDRWAFLSQVPW